MSAPLILLHGFTGAPASWEEVLGALPARPTRLLAPPLFGHHGAPAGTTSFVAEVDRLAALIRAGNMARGHLVGYSLGARLALGVLVRHPGLAGSATLIGVHPGLDDPAERAARVAADQRWRALLQAGALAAFVDAWEAQPLWASQARVPAAARAAWRAVRLAHRPEGLDAALAGLGLGVMPPLAGAAAEVAVPVRLVAGADDVRFTAIARGLAARLPHAEVALIPACGHNPLLEQPAALAALLAATPGGTP